MLYGCELDEMAKSTEWLFVKRSINVRWNEAILMETVVYIFDQKAM